MNAQNQRFLRLQMKQKKESQEYHTNEKRQHKQEWDSITPAETLDHIRQAANLKRSAMVDQMMSHDQQINDK